MNWPGILLAGFAANPGAHLAESGAQQLHLTRMSCRTCSGDVHPQPGPAKVIGFFAHLINARCWRSSTSRSQRHGWSGAVRGMLIGLIHSASCCWSWCRSCPRSIRGWRACTGATELRHIEPPSAGLYYGVTTPLMVVLSHLAFGMVVARSTGFE